MSTFEACRNRHRPTDPTALTAEIKRLAATGLTERDVADLLQLSPDAVLQILAGEGRPVPQLDGVQRP